MTTKPQDPIPSGAYSTDNEAHNIAVQAAVWRARGTSAAIFASQLHQPDELPLPSFLLQAVVVIGEKTTEGQIIEAVTIPWFEIIKLLERDANAAYQIDWRQWEEIIAGAYKASGHDAILTPRSNDGGRDVIATLPGVRIRFFEQVKAYKPDHLVTAEQVMSMVGVISSEGNVSKGIVITTSNFAPGVLKDPRITRLMPYRLELRGRDALIEWLRIAAGRK
jgi:restriction system protein